MTIVLMIIASLIILFVLYVLICGAIYLCQEICADIKKAKRRIKQGIWDLEWEWNLWKEGVMEWLTK